MNYTSLKKDKNVLIFDFDGVMINSLDEVTLTAYNAATSERVTSLADLPSALVGLFQHNRFHVQTIGDAILLMNWCLNHYGDKSELILNSHEYKALTSGARASKTGRTLRIYEARSHFIASDPQGWLALHQPYQPLWDKLIQNQKHGLVILTNKNRDATLRLCQHFGLDLDALDVYSGDEGTTKAENMRQIQKRHTGQPYSIIDDSVKNLRELEQSLNTENKKIRLLFASWGYTGPGDKEIAQEYGYPVLNQLDLIALLDKDRPVQKSAD